MTVIDYEVTDVINPKAHTGPRPHVGVKWGRVEEVDIPVSLLTGRSFYAELIQKLKALPDGKALKLEVLPPDTPKAVSNRLRFSIRPGRYPDFRLSASMGDHYIVLWERRG